MFYSTLPCFTGTVIRAGLSLNLYENQPCGLPGTAAQSAPGTVSKFPCDAPYLARYVTLDIDPLLREVIHPMLKIAEVEVEVYTAVECTTLSAFSVIGKPAWLSTTHTSFLAGNAVDGNLATIAHNGGGDPHPVLRVDLQEEVCMGRVTITLRDSGCGPQPCFLGTVIRAGLSPNYTNNQPCGLPGTAAQSTPGAVSKFPCDVPRNARYITLDIDPSQPGVTAPTLKIAEVEVEVYTAEECATEPAVDTNLAYFRKWYEGGSIVNPDPLSTKRASSLTRCALYCLKHASCLSFEFAAVLGQCHLYSQTSEDIEMTSNTDFNIYVRQY
ncbi:uncharacterized protein LOC119719686 [Patiria miniata]|uniref:Apple domain-containing protein n=1 Tax=Patiria miniata TaxID=46514 RepID=A0A913YZH5_PATMI|nr:uncharacterized protein LOC119719686 [Patiria miniata]